VKILFFSHDGKLGDAIVNTAFIDGVLQLDPQAELHALASDVSAHFWQMDQRIRKVWMYKNPPLPEAIRTSLAIRRERFDYVVTWKERFRSEKTRLLLKLARPQKGTLYEEGRIPGQVAPAIHKCAASLRLIYGEAADRIRLRYRLGIELDAPASFDEQLPPGRETILFNLFSAEPFKVIQPADAGRVLAGLARLAPEATLCLSCTNATEGHVRAAIEASGVSCRSINTDGNLHRLISLCNRADLILSTDTSLIHIASALDKPLLGIYPNDPVKSVEWAPRASRFEVVRSPTADSINGFSVEELLQKVGRLRQGM
jgi:ADP-heptose:LPS heptosyltransferase